ncbi:prolyl oligopeptidase family protein [Mycobacteroides abscessus]|nr:prolyl oligopeptidase family protein [Mycobacteroides abscessus]
MTAELSEHIEQPRITPRPAPTARPQLPRPGDLTLRERAMVETSALTDIALRTVGALSVMGVVAPSLVIDREFVARERDNLAFYGELAAMGDADLSFPEPEITPVVFSRPAGPSHRPSPRPPSRTWTSRARTRPAIPRCATIGNDSHTTVWPAPSIGVTMTAHGPRSASSTGFSAHRIC